jgi:hypothetical protein
VTPEERSEEKQGQKRAPGRRWLRGVVSAILGLGVGLCAAELIFRSRDGGAFPHLNVYAPDEALGVRLLPFATERVSFAGNPVTQVRINARGFRGADWPPPTDGEILVVGDSQVFGLGVEEGETFSAELARILASKGEPRAVLNAGVPTYGPDEYAAIASREMGERRVSTLIYVVNFVNDLFEASRPNKDRHRVWDGWAVRIETAPDQVTDFPGRAWLFRESHLFYAIRRALHGGTWKGFGAEGFRSEGTWTDLLGAASAAEESRAGASRETARLVDERRSALKKAADEVVATQLKLEEVAYKHYPDLYNFPGGIEYRKTHGNPGDIFVTERSGFEAARPGEITAQYILKGAEARANIEKLIRERAAVDTQTPEWQTVLRSFEERAERQKRLAELHAAPLEIARSWSPLLPALKAVKALGDERGAKVLVVALPMDVQVSKDEWAKYASPGVADRASGAGVPAPAIDMAPAAILIADLVESAEALGLLALDATPALAAAEPGAFLHADIHMTPKGHRALAEAIAKKLAEPPPLPGPAPGLPEGRSLAPEPEEWASAKKILLRGSRPCLARVVREWVRLRCARKAAIKDGEADLDALYEPEPAGEGAAIGASVLEGGHGEALTLAIGRVAQVIAPVLPGESLVAELAFRDKAQTLRVRRSKDGLDFNIAIEDEEPSAPAAPAKDGERAALLCACHKEVTGAAHCGELVGAPDRDCERTYGGDCEELLLCSRGAPLAAPKCLRGWVNAGALGHCYKTCGDAEPCEVGRCAAWQGASVCM